MEGIETSASMTRLLLQLGIRAGLLGSCWIPTYKRDKKVGIIARTMVRCCCRRLCAYPNIWCPRRNFATCQEHVEEKASAEELDPYVRLFQRHEGDLRAMFHDLGEDPG